MPASPVGSNPRSRDGHSARSARSTRSPERNLTPTVTDNITNETERKKSGKRRRVFQRRAPLHMRQRLQENYEEPKSGRESWWRSTIKETPNPGSYDSPDFICELGRKPNSYRFKSDGRTHNPQPQIGKGELLMPGAYQHKDLVKRLESVNLSYGFKNASRDAKDGNTLSTKDKDINISPDAYETSKYLTMTVEKQPSRHWQFRSQSERFPTIYFKPKEGPAPGKYQIKSDPAQHAVSSTFKSKTPRFDTSHTKTPGPGTYERTYKPMTSTVTKMGRQHGLFFTPQFQAY